MADRTDLFKATVKTIKLRLRKEGQVQTTLKTKKISNFVKVSKNAVEHISQLRDFLLKHRKDYVDSSGYLASEFSAMSEEERDLIDTGAQEFIKNCSQLINDVKNELESSSGQSLGEGVAMETKQTKEHRLMVVGLLQNYLKEICQLYSEQKAIRLKRLVDRKRVSRLQPEGLTRPSNHGNTTTSHRERGLEETHSPLPSQVPTPYDNQHFEETLTNEEINQFQQENTLMMEHMNSLVDEVRQIEGKVLAITKLQETFTEKILQQAEGIDNIHKLTVTATENVSEGNEEIRSAIRNKGSLRMWILFILVVCSFTLLFLDWYS